MIHLSLKPRLLLPHARPPATLDFRARALVLLPSTLPSFQQAALAEECREVCKLRRVAVIACSICAFLGLKALMGCPGAAAPCFTAAATAATSTVAGHAPAEDYTNAKGAGRAELAGEDLERMVAVKVEPLAASGI